MPRPATGCVTVWWMWPPLPLVLRHDRAATAIVGPSGVGKDSVITALVAAEPRLVLARRVITRPAGAGGEHFDGVTQAQFAQMRAAGAFALAWSAHGLAYGIPVGIRADLAAGRDVLANLSRAVLAEAQRAFDGMVVIALTAQPDVLAARLAARGREDAAQIAGRLARLGDELPPGVCAHVVPNDRPLPDTVAAITALLYPVRP